MKRRVEMLEFDDFTQELYLFLEDQIQRERDDLALMQDGLDNVGLEENSAINVAVVQALRSGIQASEHKILELEMAQRAVEKFIAFTTRRTKEAWFREVYSQMELYHEEVKTFVELEAKGDRQAILDQNIVVRGCEAKLAELGYPVLMGIETYVAYLERFSSSSP